MRAVARALDWLALAFILVFGVGLAVNVGAACCRCLCRVWRRGK